MRKILNSLFIAFALTLPSRAADLRKVLLSMPDTIMPTLSASDFQDFLDYHDNGMTGRARTRLGGESVMADFQDRRLTILTSSVGKTDIALYEQKKSKRDIICVINTVTAEYSDSRIAFYTEDWQPIPTAELIDLPAFDDFLTRKALKSDSIDVFRRRSMLRLSKIVPVENALVISYSSLGYIGPVESDRYREFLKPDPLCYMWNGKRFRMRR